MKKFIILVSAMLLVVGMIGTAGAAAVYLEGVTPGTGWTDADGTDDNYMCWAAAAANALAFTGWDGGFTATAADTHEDVILDYFKDYWNDGTGNAYYGAKWFFDGLYQPQDDPTTPLVDESLEPIAGTTMNTGGGGGFYSTDHWSVNNGAWHNVDDDPDTPENEFFELSIQEIQLWVDRSREPNHQYYGGSYGIMGHMSGGLGHYINIWGYDLVTNEVWITDNNDAIYGMRSVAFSSLDLDFIERINENGARVDYPWVAPNTGSGPDPVPEPATMLLLGTGLVGLVGLGRKKFFRG